MVSPAVVRFIVIIKNQDTGRRYIYSAEVSDFCGNSDGYCGRAGEKDGFRFSWN